MSSHVLGVSLLLLVMHHRVLLGVELDLDAALQGVPLLYIPGFFLA